MLNIYKESELGKGNHGWLTSWFHFSFAGYQNPKRVHFGPLRVINDDLIAPKTGFPTHSHEDMEIISYVIQGSLSHTDSMNNTKTIYKGQVQYLSAGTGITHSEYNYGDEPTRLLQLWIYPDKKGHIPQYGDYEFKWEDRINKFLHLISSQYSSNNTPIKLHQDADIYALFLDKDKTIDFNLPANKQVYIVLIDGKSNINNQILTSKDGMDSDENLIINALEDSHFLLIQVNK